MPRMNLIPWREAHRQQLNREFVMVLFFFLLLAGVAVYAAYYQASALLGHQHSRNTYLRDRISSLQQDLEEIKRLDEIKEKLLTRTDVVQDLQVRRPQVVHVFHEFASTIPQGIYLTVIEQKGDLFTLRGRTESSARVSSYMRNLERSEWLRKPRLLGIKLLNDQQNQRLSDFTLEIEQTTPELKQEQDANSAGEGAPS